MIELWVILTCSGPNYGKFREALGFMISHQESRGLRSMDSIQIRNYQTSAIIVDHWSVTYSRKKYRNKRNLNE